MFVPLLDLRAQYESLKPALLEKLHALFESQQFILGPAVESFEKAACAYTGAKHAIGMSSGTDAQLAVLMALGIGPGDAVITTPFTFFATAGCVSRVGARPLFVDIDPATFNLSPGKLEEFLSRECHTDSMGIVRWNQHKVRAIIPVHLFGACCDMDAICEIAGRYQLPVLEDAAQALGAEFRGEQQSGHAGTIGAAGWYSFFPAKNLGAFGDAGMAVCNDDALAAKLRSIRNHGMEPQYYHKVVGGNFRLDALQAAVLEIKLPHLDAWSRARRSNAAYYRERMAAAGLKGVIRCPEEPWAGRGFERHHIYHQFVIRTAHRDALRAFLQQRGVSTAIYYPVSLHEQECFKNLGYKTGDFPESERATREVLALPIYPDLTREQQDFAVEQVLGFFDR